MLVTPCGGGQEKRSSVRLAPVLKWCEALFGRPESDSVQKHHRGKSPAGEASLAGCEGAAATGECTMQDRGVCTAKAIRITMSAYYPYEHLSPFRIIYLLLWVLDYLCHVFGCLPECMCVCARCTCSARGDKRVPGRLELKFQTVVSGHVGTGN